jgi:hypothetical protein
MSFMVTSVLRSPTQPATPVSAITTQYLRAFIEQVTQDCSWLVSIGRVRMRLPVTAKIAFVIAGVTQAQGASPTVAVPPLPTPASTVTEFPH